MSDVPADKFTLEEKKECASAMISFCEGLYEDFSTRYWLNTGKRLSRELFDEMTENIRR